MDIATRFCSPYALERPAAVMQSPIRTSNQPKAPLQMYVGNTKRLLHAGARKMAATAIDKAREAGIAITVAITDAGGHLVLLERMDGGRFHTVHSCTTKAVCASSNKRVTSA